MPHAFLFTSALRDFVRPRRVAVWILVALSLYLAARFYLTLNPIAARSEAYALLSGSLAFRILPLASAIFSTAVIAQEVEQKTIVYLLTRPIPRWTLLLTRTLASMLVVFAISVIGATAVSVAVYGFQWNPYLGWDIAAIAVGAAAYGSLFVLLTLMINRAMIVSLLFAFGWETGIPNMRGSIYYLSINSYLTSIARRPPIDDDGTLTLQVLGGLANGSDISLSVAWIGMSLLVAVCLGVAMWWFTNFEYVPREDAE